MIDVPNLLIGFVLGFLVALLFWLLDRGHAKEQRKLDTLDSWMSVAQSVELLIHLPTTTAWDVHEATVRYPIDRWRGIVGGDGFRLLEQLKVAMGAFEKHAQPLQNGISTEHERARFERARAERRDAEVAFANFVRKSKSADYNRIAMKEERSRLRKDYRSHPFSTWKREKQRRRAWDEKMAEISGRNAPEMPKQS